MSNDGKPTRESIDSVARDLREATGGRLTAQEARDRVERAVRSGDNKRSNGGR